MHWVAFALVTYVVCVLQTTLMGWIEIHAIRPELPAMVATFYALLARRPDALLAATLLGLAVDLNSAGPATRGALGVHALAFGVAALAVVRVREVLDRDNVLTYVMLVAVWVFAAALAMAAHAGWARSSFAEFRADAGRGLHAALYSALVAPYLHGILRRLRVRLGLEQARTYRVRT
ncbi:MAG: rod shape-determining protein MreD [Phycisphaerae bacterium]